MRAVRNGDEGAPGMKVESLEGRGVAGPARDQLPLRRRAEGGGRPRHLQDGRQGARAPVRHVGDLHGEAGPHVGRLVVPHPLVALARRRRPRSPASRRSSSSISPARSRCASELAIFFAPTINSYKRYAAGSWAPTTLAWAYDNRTCGFRIVGHGSSLRPETRIPGADANPYLAFAALLASGLHGIEQKLELGPAFEGNAYESDVERFPHTLREAIARLERRDGRARAARRRGRRPLPELRAHRAAAVRPGRDGLRARADVRAWLAPRRSSASRRTSSPRRGGTGSSTPRSSRTTTCARSSARAHGRCSCRRATTGSTRRSTRSTASIFSGGADLDPEPTGGGASRDERRAARARPRGAGAARGGARARHARARDLPRLAGAERRARRRPRAAPARARRPRAAPRDARASSPSTTSEIDDGSRLGAAARRRARR